MNISEFAKIAGVSRSAVSRYFNDGYLSEDKKKQIEEAIEKTGYAPSLAARNTSNRVTKLVGVIIPKLSSESCARVTEGISAVLDKEGADGIALLFLAVGEGERAGGAREGLGRTKGVGVLQQVAIGYHLEASGAELLAEQDVELVNHLVIFLPCYYCI